TRACSATAPRSSSRGREAAAAGPALLAPPARASPVDEDDLPELAAGGEALVGLVGCIHRQLLGDRYRNGPVGQQWEHMLLHGSGHRSLVVPRPRPQRRAADGGPAPH